MTLPERDQFASANGYYQTAMHELGHATGHSDRMNRETLTNGVGDFGSTEYAREELRAEISAMMTGERIGIGHDGSRGAAYVEGWLKALEKDPKEIYKARRTRNTSLTILSGPSATAPRRPSSTTVSWPRNMPRRARLRPGCTTSRSRRRDSARTGHRREHDAREPARGDGRRADASRRLVPLPHPVAFLRHSCISASKRSSR